MAPAVMAPAVMAPAEAAPARRHDRSPLAAGRHLVRTLTGSIDELTSDLPARARAATAGAATTAATMAATTVVSAASATACSASHAAAAVASAALSASSAVSAGLADHIAQPLTPERRASIVARAAATTSAAAAAASAFIAASVPVVESGYAQGAIVNRAAQQSVAAVHQSVAAMMRGPAAKVSAAALCALAKADDWLTRGCASAGTVLVLAWDRHLLPVLLAAGRALRQRCDASLRKLHLPPLPPLGPLKQTTARAQRCGLLQGPNLAVPGVGHFHSPAGPFVLRLGACTLPAIAPPLADSVRESSLLRPDAARATALTGEAVAAFTGAALGSVNHLVATAAAQPIAISLGSACLVTLTLVRPARLPTMSAKPRAKPSTFVFTPAPPPPRGGGALRGTPASFSAQAAGRGKGFAAPQAPPVSQAPRPLEAQQGLGSTAAPMGRRILDAAEAAWIAARVASSTPTNGRLGTPLASTERLAPPATSSMSQPNTEAAEAAWVATRTRTASVAARLGTPAAFAARWPSIEVAEAKWMATREAVGSARAGTRTASLGPSNVKAAEATWIAARAASSTAEPARQAQGMPARRPDVEAAEAAWTAARLTTVSKERV